MSKKSKKSRKRVEAEQINEENDLLDEDLDEDNDDDYDDGDWEEPSTVSEDLDDYEDEDDDEGEYEEDDDLGEESREEEEEDDSLPTYEAAMSYKDSDGKLVKAGDLVTIKCKNCALWKTEWAGEVRCDVGNTVGVGVCTPEEFSCKSFFVPMDQKEMLDVYLSFGPAEVLLISKMINGMKRVLGGPGGPQREGWLPHREWVTEWVEKEGLDVDPTDAYSNAFSLVTSIYDFDVHNMMAGFFTQHASLVKSKFSANKKNQKKPYRIGDQVEWTDRVNDERLKGVITRIGGRGLKGQMCIVVVHPVADAGKTHTYQVTEWQRDLNPTVLVKAEAR